MGEGDPARRGAVAPRRPPWTVVQCVMTAKYKMLRPSLNTGAGTVTPQTIDALTELIDAGIR